jgi:hypothetical protein
MPPPVHHKTERSYSNPDPTPLWKIMLEVGAVAVGIIVAGIYYGQLCVMRGQLGEIIKQYPELQKSAEAAKSAAETANSTLQEIRNSERPWLTVRQCDITTLELNKKVEGRVVFVNSGKSIAIVGHGWSNMLITNAEIPNLLPYKKGTEKTKATSIIAPGSETAFITNSEAIITNPVILGRLNCQT